MVKEIEISNTTESLQDNLQVADFELYPDIITAVLSDNGQTMTVKVNRILKEGWKRKVALYYMLPKYEQQMVAEYELEVFGPSDTDLPSILTPETTTEYEFDLGPVLSTIVHTAPEQLADDTITIRLFTYEANISTDYGTKTLHVPYTVSYPSNYIVPASTDGWYTLRVSDIMTYVSSYPYVSIAVDTLTLSNVHNWSMGQSILYTTTDTAAIANLTSGTKYYVILTNNGSEVKLATTLENAMAGTQIVLGAFSGAGTITLSPTYVVDDMVWYNNGTEALYTCIVDSTGNLPTNTTYWELVTAEVERNMYEFGHEYSDTIATILNSNMLVTRYIKQKYIYDLLIKSNYKRHDNITVVTQLEKLFAMREAAVIHMNMGNPLMARHMLDLITIENNSFSTNNGERKVIEMITNFTI